MERAVTGVAPAGVAYVATVLAAGFVPGVARTLALAPRLGEFTSVALELPIMLTSSMLTSSWLAARRVIVWRCVAADLASRLAMGGIAFLLLMLAEAAISVLGLGRTLARHLAGYQAPAAMPGPAGQIVFALPPAVQIRTHPPRRRPRATSRTACSSACRNRERSVREKAAL